MKCMKCVAYMAIGAGMALLYKMYESDILCMCKKIMKTEQEMLKDSLEIE